MSTKKFACKSWLKAKKKKKMDHLAPQFLQMKEPELFYTDNIIGDQGFLKEVIPTLNKDIVPVGKDANGQQKEDPLLLLPVATLPGDVNIRVVSSEAEINNACIELFGNTDAYTFDVYVGFDCEWVMSTSGISLIQICLQNKVVLFRVQQFW
jgi:hypothetical protein